MMLVGAAHAVTSIAQPAPAPIPTPSHPFDLLQYVLALAAMSATVGSIVVVFIYFGIQELASKRAQQHNEPMHFYRFQRELGRIELLMRTAAVAMGALLTSSVFLLLGIAARPLRLQTVAVVATGAFTFSVAAILLALLTYFVFEHAAERVDHFGPQHLVESGHNEIQPEAA